MAFPINMAWMMMLAELAAQRYPPMGEPFAVDSLLYSRTGS
jgi:hypothetical protein